MRMKRLEEMVGSYWRMRIRTMKREGWVDVRGTKLVVIYHPLSLVLVHLFLWTFLIGFCIEGR